MINKYKVTVIAEIIEVDIEATSISHAKAIMEEDIKSRVHKGDVVTVVSSSAEIQND